MATKKILIQIQVSEKEATAAISKVTQAVEGLATAQVKNTTATTKGRAQSGLNNAILLETGRLASDASYGFGAIANNLGQVISLFQSFARTNGGFVASMKVLLKSIWGVGGLMIGIQLLISFGPQIIKFFKGAATAEEIEAKALKELNKELDANIQKRERQVKLIEQSLLLVTKVTMDSLGNLVTEIDASQEKLMELAFRFNQAGISNTKILTDEELSLKTRVKIAKEMFDIFKEETRLITLRRKEREALSSGDLDRVKDLRAQIILSQKEILESSKAIDKLSEKTESGILRGKVKSLADLTKEEFDSLFLYLEKRADDSGFILEKMLEGWTMNQIDMSLKASEILDTAGDAGIEALSKLVESDDKYAKKRKDNSDAILKINKIERDSRLQALDDIGKGLMAASQIAGKATGAGKALAIASTTISTYSAAQKAYESQMVPSIDSPIRAAIAASAAIAQGLANVRAIMAVKTAGIDGVSVSGTGAGAGVEAPDFNVVGTGGASQLASGLASITGKPIQAFVVSKEISSAQELDRNITSTATLG